VIGDKSRDGVRVIARVSVSNVNKALIPLLSLLSGCRKISHSGHPSTSAKPGHSFNGSPESDRIIQLRDILLYLTVHATPLESIRERILSL